MEPAALVAVRRLAPWRVADFVLGREAYAWLEPGWALWSQQRGYIGTQDDEALARALQALDELRRPDESRRKRGSHTEAARRALTLLLR
jgi:hypothetical protein